MSRLYYFASDTILEPQPNPYVKLLSVNQALELGLEVHLEAFGDDFDRDEPNVILFCEDETQLQYPNIYPFNKEEYYDEIGTTRQFCTALEWTYSADTVEVVLGYIRKHMKTAAELEVWSVWLGAVDMLTNLKRMYCKSGDLTAERLKKLFNSELDYLCLLVSN